MLGCIRRMPVFFMDCALAQAIKKIAMQLTQDESGAHPGAQPG
jgi:hypothetical protein